METYTQRRCSSDEIRQGRKRLLGRYEQWSRLSRAALFDPILPHVTMSRQEKERAIVAWLRGSGMTPVGERRLLDVGCGGGGDLLLFLRLGFAPENLVGSELRVERAERARKCLPESVVIHTGDACELDLPDGTFDIVYQSTVFSSILEAGWQGAVADRMWSLVRPGGMVLCYEFIFDNPRNPDVRGITAGRFRELFPTGEIRRRRITLAPPISRRVCRVHPGLYSLFNLAPWLRTHMLCWIRKPE